jgi:hypothetical protein
MRSFRSASTHTFCQLLFIEDVLNFFPGNHKAPDEVHRGENLEPDWPNTQNHHVTNHECDEKNQTNNASPICFFLAFFAHKFEQLFCSFFVFWGNV